MGMSTSLSVALFSWLLWGFFDQIAAGNVSVSGVNAIPIESDDPLLDFHIEYPRDGGVSTLPLKFRFAIFSSTADAFKARYGEMFVCVELEGATTTCSPVMGTNIRFRELARGQYVARAYVWNAETGERHRETDPLSLSIVTTDEFDIHTSKLIESYREDQQFPPDLNILQWAEQYKQEETTSQSGVANDSSASDVLLVIGVKSAVVTNFARRQAIRETWASKATLSAHIKVLFLGCSPNVETIPSSRDRLRIQAAIDLENAVYGDLLTGELDCEDSHLLLAEKVGSFLEWLVAELPQTRFVMIADDDVYARADLVLEDRMVFTPHERLYLGERMDSLHRQPLRPIRVPTNPYYTSKLSYPMDQFVPYAAGPHFLLSMDCVRFIARNRRRLASLNGQDDTSIALWLVTIQVHLQHSSALSSLRSRPCEDKALSLADLSPLAIRAIHANLLSNRTLCHGFDRLVWQWKSAGAIEDILNGA